VALAEPLKDSVLLAELAGIAVEWVSEDKASLVQDPDLVPLVQYTALVSAYEGVVDKRAISGKILQDSNRVTTLVFKEDQTVPVRNRRRIYDTV
jgi:hypothetical protein